MLVHAELGAGDQNYEGHPQREDLQLQLSFSITSAIATCWELHAPNSSKTSPVPTSRVHLLFLNLRR